MRTVNDLHGYQVKAVEFQCSHDASALWLDVGLGKTITTLTSIAHKINTGEIKAVIIVAPIRVCRLVWRQEALRWCHTKHLTFSMVLGDKDQRIRGLLTNANVYLINYENIEWLATSLKTYYLQHNKELPFDGIVYDELSKTKNSATNRVKSLRKILPQFKWRTGLTGTPASNGYKDLHGQFLVLDGGERLGTSKTAFRTRFYRKEGPYKEVPYSDTEEVITQLIGDITLEMSAADYNPLPDLIVNDVFVELTPELRESYERMERELFIELDSGTEVEMFNAASLTNKCLQFANGAMYPVAGVSMWEPIHDLKLDALEDILEEANGKPLLCSYSYRSDAERIIKRFGKEFGAINMTECKSEKSLNDAMQKWHSGECRLLVGHSASLGHGIDNLQRNGGSLVWFGLNWSLELYDQFNGRIRRQGRGDAPVVCHRILIQDTLDMAQSLALEDKATTQTALRKAVKEYRNNKK